MKTRQEIIDELGKKMSHVTAREALVLVAAAILGVLIDIRDNQPNKGA